MKPPPGSKRIRDEGQTWPAFARKRSVLPFRRRQKEIRPGTALEGRDGRYGVFAWLGK